MGWTVRQHPICAARRFRFPWRAVSSGRLSAMLARVLGVHLMNYGLGPRQTTPCLQRVFTEMHGFCCFCSCLVVIRLSTTLLLNRMAGFGTDNFF